MKQLLAYAHPVIQVLVLLMALATLRLGLALKKHRTRRHRLQSRSRVLRRHTRLGMLFVACLSAGYLLGLISMSLLRDCVPFQSAHFFFATVAVLLFLGGGYAGWCLKQGTERYADVRAIHGFLVYLGLVASAGVAVMGFILLP